MEIKAIKVSERKYLYTIEQKRAILKEQQVTGESNRAIGIRYKVGESSFRKWKKRIDIHV
jgi:hypothetical protein